MSEAPGKAAVAPCIGAASVRLGDTRGPRGGQVVGPALLAGASLVAGWGLVVAPWLEARFGLAVEPWEHVLIETLLALLALASIAGLVGRQHARQQEAEDGRVAAEARYRQLVEALRRCEDRYRQLVESTRDWVWEVDASGVYTYCSPRCRELLGYEPEELLGRTIFDRLPEPEARRLRPLFARLAAECGPIEGIEVVRLHRDGHETVVETRAHPILGSAGELLGYRGVDRDVGERRRAAETIRALNAELEERVHRRTAELESAYRELESFSYSVSHDLRAPLRSIDGFSQALLEDCGDRLDASGREYLDRVRAATRRMGGLIDDLLALSRVTRQEMLREPVDLSAIALAVGAELAAGQAARVDLQVQPGLEILGDPKLLRLALWNLLENAWKFTGHRELGHVELGRARNGVYFVRDDGAGFDMAYAHKLFTPFQRLHAAEEFPGTGVGLAIVQRVIHRHGGRIWAEAAPGVGATFHFTLPQPHAEGSEGEVRAA